MASLTQLAMPDNEDRNEEKKSWKVNPAIFQVGEKPGLPTRIWTRLRSVGRMIAFALLLTYPITLPLTGILFGGTAFWTTFAGSIVLIALLLSKFGYAKNFNAWNPSFLKQTLSLTLGFIFAIGSYLGLVYLRLWIIPVMIGLPGAALVLFFWRKSAE